MTEAPPPQEPQRHPSQQSFPPGHQFHGPPDHPRATTSLVLGISGLVLCQVLGPVAWAVGQNTAKEIEASRGTLGGLGSAKAGQILGIIATVLLVIGVVVVVVIFILGLLFQQTYNW